MGARASLVHVVVQRRFVCGVGVREVSGSALEGSYCVVGVDDERQARRGGGRGVLSQGLGNPGRVVVEVEPGVLSLVDDDALVAALPCQGLAHVARTVSR